MKIDLTDREAKILLDFISERIYDGLVSTEEEYVVMETLMDKLR